MSDQPLIVRDDARLTVTWTPAAFEMKESALATAGLIGRVSTPDENAAAVEAAKAIAFALKQCEQTRKACKEPIIDFGRKIDDTAKAFRAELDSEKLRLDKLLGDYMQLVEAKRKAAEKARQLEEEKLQKEREAEERRIREESAARQRQLDEEARKAEAAAQAARNAKELAQAEARQAEIDRQRALSEAQSHQQLEAVQERTNQAAAMLVTVPEAVRADGQSVSEEWVIDQIREFELMKARPDLVRKVEFDLIAIKALLKAGVKLPGVTAHKETKSKVRAGRAPVMIEV